MAKNEDVALNWVNEKVNRMYRRVEWRGHNMFCKPDTVYSYGLHYPIAHRTRLKRKGREIFLFNTERTGYSYSGTPNHSWYVRREIMKINGICINVNNGCLHEVSLPLLHNIAPVNILDVTRNGEALIQSLNGYTLITQDAMIHIENSYDSVKEAKKSLKPKGLGTDYFRWRNYYFKPTGMNDKEFAASQKLTIAALNKWTRQDVVYHPYSACYDIRARIFGSNSILTAFNLKNENPAPFVSGVIYDDGWPVCGKTILKTKGEWWKVFPMNCNAYRLI